MNLLKELKEVVFSYQAAVDTVHKSNAAGNSVGQSKRSRAVSKGRSEPPSKPDNANAKLGPKSNSSNNLGGFSASTESLNVSQICCFCEGCHKNHLCTAYTTVQARKNRAQQLKLCLGCLRKGHLFSQCKMPLKPCYGCGSRHNSAFCNASENKTRSSGKVTVPSLKQEQIIVTDVSTSSPVVPSAFIDNSVTRTILPMCVEAVVTNPWDLLSGKKVVVQFNKNFEGTFVVEEFAKALGIIGTEAPVTTVVNSFTASGGAAQILEPVELGIWQKDGNLEIIKARPVRGFGTKLQTIFLTENEIPDLMISSHLSKPLVWHQPQVYIGSNYFYKFVKMEHQTKSGFMYHGTLLGPSISGNGLIKKVEKVDRKLEDELAEMRRAVDELWTLDSDKKIDSGDRRKS